MGLLRIPSFLSTRKASRRSALAVALGLTATTVIGHPPALASSNCDLSLKGVRRRIYLQYSTDFTARTDDDLRAAAAVLQVQVSRDLRAAWGIDADIVPVVDRSEDLSGEWLVTIAPLPLCDPKDPNSCQQNAH